MLVYSIPKMSKNRLVECLQKILGTMNLCLGYVPKIRGCSVI